MLETPETNQDLVLEDIEDVDEFDSGLNMHNQSSDLVLEDIEDVDEFDCGLSQSRDYPAIWCDTLSIYDILPGLMESPIPVA